MIPPLTLLAFGGVCKTIAVPAILTTGGAAAVAVARVRKWLREQRTLVVSSDVVEWLQCLEDLEDPEEVLETLRGTLVARPATGEEVRDERLPEVAAKQQEVISLLAAVLDHDAGRGPTEFDREAALARMETLELSVAGMYAELESERQRAPADEAASITRAEPDRLVQRARKRRARGLLGGYLGRLAQEPFGDDTPRSTAHTMAVRKWVAQKARERGVREHDLPGVLAYAVEAYYMPSRDAIHARWLSATAEHQRARADLRTPRVWVWSKFLGLPWPERREVMRNERA